MNESDKDHYIRLKIPRSIFIGLILLVAGAALGAGGVALYTQVSDSHQPKQATTTATIQKSQPASSTPKANPSSIAKSIFGVFSTKKSAEMNNATVQTDVTTSTQVIPSTTLLSIENIKNSVNGSSVTISWETSVDAKSQLILDSGKGQGFESLNGIGTVHKVVISDLPDNRIYDFQIVAHTPDGKLSDDSYGEFQTQKVYIASLSGSINTVNCRSILITDTSGKPAENKSFVVTIFVKDQTNIQIPSVAVTTDSSGAVDSWNHCESANYGRNVTVQIDK